LEPLNLPQLGPSTLRQLLAILRPELLQRLALLASEPPPLHLHAHVALVLSLNEGPELYALPALAGEQPDRGGQHASGEYPPPAAEQI